MAWSAMMINSLLEGVVAGARIVTATGTDKGEKSALVEVRGFH